MDVETWLQTLEPRVIDAWLAYEAVDPEAFAVASPGRQSGDASPGGRLLDPGEAARRMAKRLG